MVHEMNSSKFVFVKNLKNYNVVLFHMSQCKHQSGTIDIINYVSTYFILHNGMHTSSKQTLSSAPSMILE